MDGRRSARLLLLAVVLLAVLFSSASGASARAPSRTAFAGLGTWLDIYATDAWRNPEAQVAAMALDGVRTLYVETGNYSQKVDLLRPGKLGRVIDAAHAARIRVVAWYLPSFVNLRKDERRALAAIRFQSASGERFNAFALDIEATVVRSIPQRNRRLLELSARLRRDVGPRYALGAITPSPVGMSPFFWPRIPYRRLTRSYNAFLPMAYFTLRGINSRAATRSFLTATVGAIRRASGDANLPIHLIGGLSGAMGTRAIAGFMQAVARCRPLGFSLYAFPQTTPAAWKELGLRSEDRGSCR